jgi:type III secretion protein J
MKKTFLCGSLLFMGLVFAVGCSRQLEAGLSQDDAHQIVVRLRESGMNASAELDPSDKKAATWTVNVRGDSETVIKAWKLLHENGLPRERVGGLSDVFANAGMIPTESEEKARLLSGLEGELTRTLNSLAGVMDTRVHVVLPDNNPLMDKSQQSPPTASVLIQYHSDSPPLREAEVKSLIAKSIEGLTSENVVVVFKKVEIAPIPREGVGSLSWSALIEIGVVGFAVAAGIISLLVLSLSQQRKFKIKALEKQLTQLRAAQPVLPVEKA